MAYFPIATEYGAIYTLTNGAWTAVFNDPTDPNYVGMLTEVTGLDSAEVRENSTDLVESDGGVHGSFYMGRRPIVMTGKVFGHSTIAARSLRLDKARNASLALRSDATLSWASSAYNYRGAVAGLSPSQYLTLRETSGTVASDFSGNGRNGTYGGTFTLAQPGATVDGSQSVLLDGGSGKVTTTYNPAPQGSTLSVSGWAYRRTNATGDTLFGGDLTSYWLRGTAGTNDLQWSANTSVGVTFTGAAPLASWFHWALVYNDTTRAATLYVNGVSQGTQTISAGNGFIASPGNIEYGMRTGAGDPFDGYIEDVAVWNRALTSTEVSALYAAGGVGTIRLWVPVRRQQPFRETEGWNKSFQISLVSQYSQIFGWNLKTSATTAAGTPVVLENQGNYPAYPILRITGVSGNTTTVTDGNGGTFKTLNTLSLAAAEVVEFDMLNHTGVFTVGARAGQSATRYIDFTSITQWPALVTGNNTFTLASGAAGSLAVVYRDTWA